MLFIPQKRNLVGFVFTALAWTISLSATTEAFSNTAYGSLPNHLSPQDGQFHVLSNQGEGVAQIFASQNVSGEYSDDYAPPFEGERPPRAAFWTIRRSTKARFLTIIQMGNKGAFETRQLSMKDGQMDVGAFVVKAEMNDDNPPMIRVAGNGAQLIAESGNVPMLSGTENGDSTTKPAPFLPPDHLNILPAPDREDETMSRPQALRIHARHTCGFTRYSTACR